MKFTKAKKVGVGYEHIFKMDDGSMETVQITQEDYEQLGTATPVNPTINGGTWHLSHAYYIFDTLSGKLEEGKYHDTKDGFDANIGGIVSGVKAEDIVEGIMSDAVLKKLTDERLTKNLVIK